MFLIIQYLYLNKFNKIYIIYNIFLLFSEGLISSSLNSSVPKVLAKVVFPEPFVCPQTGDGEIVPAAVQSGETIVFSRNETPLFVQRRFHADFIMLEGQVSFGGGVVLVFRADMFERCQASPPWFVRP